MTSEDLMVYGFLKLSLYGNKLCEDLLKIIFIVSHAVLKVQVDDKRIFIFVFSFVTQPFWMKYVT